MLGPAYTTMHQKSLAGRRLLRHVHNDRGGQKEKI